MRVARTLMAAGAAVLFAQAAVAQTNEIPTGSRVGRAKPADIPESSGLSEEDRGRAATYQFAECAIGSNPGRVDAYLALKADDTASDKALDKLATDECLRFGELSMPNFLLRGALFRSAYVRRFRQAPAALAPAEIKFESFLADPASARSVQYLIRMDFGDCVARADLANADAMVRSEVGSEAEKKAVAALVPKLGPCLPAGAKVTMNRSVISAALSEALYREALAAQSGGVSGKH